MCGTLLTVSGFDPIRAAAAVDHAWLTAALHRAVGTGRLITSIEARSIGTGRVGENVRFELRWTDGDGRVPPSVVGKFPATSPVDRATAAQVDTYRREVGFYRDIRPLVSIRTPEILHLGWNPDTHDFVLIMEDIRGGEPGDQLVGCSVARAEAAIDEVVGLHAPTWGRVDELRHLDWLAFPSAERTAQIEQLLVASLPGFVDRYEHLLTEDEREAAGRIVANYRTLAGRTADWAEGPGAWCVAHSDYRLDNILFGVTNGAPPVCVVDWQSTRVGTGPADVAYFLGAALLPDDRRHHERELVDRYAAGLRASGVAVDDDAVWDGYVLGSAGGMLMAIIASQIVEQTERGDEMFVAMTARHAAQIHDVGLLSVL
jgi:hypothetical protein